jgi:hypothetical protein
MAVNKQPFRLMFQWDKSVPASLVSGKFTRWARVIEGGVLETEYETPVQDISFEAGQPGIPLATVMNQLQQDMAATIADLQAQLTAKEAQRVAETTALQAEVDRLTVENDGLRRGTVTP